MNDAQRGIPHDEVIEPADWMRRRAVEALARGDRPAARRELRRLLEAAGGEEHRLFALSRLGVVEMEERAWSQARRYLERAREMAPDDPCLLYALGNCAQAQRRWWQALLYSMEAIHLHGGGAQAAEFMRSGAVSLRALGFDSAALSMLRGALDRCPADPRILKTLAEFHERDGAWEEALEVRERMLEALGDEELPNPGEERCCSTPPEEDTRSLNRYAERLSERVREQFRVLSVEDAPGPRVAPELTPTNLPPGLFTLAHTLMRHDRARELVGSALRLWALARHERLDDHVPYGILAAAIHWLVERLEWRMTTSHERLERLYEVDFDTVRATVRLLVACLEISYVPTREARRGLSAREVARLADLQCALLFGGELREQRTAVAMLE